MDDSLEPRNTSDSEKALSVSEALNLAKGALEGVFVRILGEVSELSINARYKAIYFTIKDKSSSLPCMMWNNRYTAQGVQLQIGALVEISGRFSLYAAKGRMNFDVYSVELAGEGKLRMQVAELARRLKAEGLMEPARKKPLPVMPKHIGVVTSPRGAAVYDVLRTLRRRFPLAQVSVAGVTVEGKSASTEIALGLDAVQAAGVDVILLVRGGGSFEDLMPFNDETIARKIASLDVPIVTGIGHEPDTSIADMISDLRASTPTAAAEAVVPAISELFAQIHTSAYRLNNAAISKISSLSAKLEILALAPVLSDPFRQLEQTGLRLDDFARRLPIAIERSITPKKSRLLALVASLDALSPLAVLARGYAIARDENNRVLRNASDIKIGSKASVQLEIGSFNCTVDSITTADNYLEE